MNTAEIEAEIQKLENSDTTYENCMKLATLYTIIDHTVKRVDYSKAGSEFLLAVSRSDLDHVFEVLDEHMDCIKLLYPKEYSAIIKRIEE